MADKTVSLATVIAKEAERREMTTKAVGSQLRGRLRKHDIKTLEKAGYTNLSSIKKVSNDRTNWPPMPVTFARKLLKGDPVA